MRPRPPVPLLALLFLLFAAPVLGFLAMKVPTGDVPDEVAHVVRMDSLLHGVIVGHREPGKDQTGANVPVSGVTADPALLAAGFTFIPGTKLAERVLTRARVRELEALTWSPAPEFVRVPNTAVYAPVFYVPGAIGLGLAQLSGMGPFRAMLAARAANALCFAVLGFAALVLARRLQGVLFATLCLPMTLQLGASCNQDGLLIAVSVLMAALLTRGTMRAWWAAAVAMGLIGMGKPLYLPMAGAVAMLVPVPVPALRLRAAGFLVAAVPGVLWYLVASHYAVVPFVRGGPYAAGPNWIGPAGEVFGTVDAGRQLLVLLHHPSLLLTLPVDTCMHECGWLGWQTIGILGILDILLPHGLYTLWTVGLVAVFVGEMFSAPGWAGWRPGWSRLLVGLCVAASVLALFDGQYLSWSETGAALVQGMQGRYFTPVLAFAGLALPTLGGWRGRAVCRVLRAPVVLAGLVGLVIIPSLMVSVYYLR